MKFLKASALAMAVLAMAACQKTEVVDSAPKTEPAVSINVDANAGTTTANVGGTTVTAGPDGASVTTPAATDAAAPAPAPAPAEAAAPATSVQNPASGASVTVGADGKVTLSNPQAGGATVTVEAPAAAAAAASK
jgi:2-oxoglutarate dehydrogenase E2 component (dihydrolipoamide succinyltransferase)